MNILITGANGFLGREFDRIFSDIGYSVIKTSRDELDVSKKEQVEDFFCSNDIDIVLHTAIKGGRRGRKVNFDDFIKNISMYKNLEDQSDKFKLMFTFGSGAAYDRAKQIDNISEEQIKERIPIDYYGLSKNLIAREITRHNSNIINLRLFGCFSAGEAADRFIKSALLNTLSNKPIIIHQNRKMDFFHIEDLAEVMKYYIENYSEDLPKDINMCYEDKYTLKEITDSINRLTNSKIKVILENKDFGRPYTGSPQKLLDLPIPLNGFERALAKTYKKIRGDI